MFHLVLSVFWVWAIPIVLQWHHHSDLRFPDDIKYRPSFQMLICHLYIFFGEVSVKVFGSFKK